MAKNTARCQLESSTEGWCRGEELDDVVIKRIILLNGLAAQGNVNVHGTGTLQLSRKNTEKGKNTVLRTEDPRLMK